MSETVHDSRLPRATLGALALFLLIGGWLRVRGVGAMPLFGDEYHTALEAADRDLGTILSSFDLYGSHVVLPLLQKLSMDLFGPGTLPFRLPALVPGLLLLAVAFPLLRRFVGAGPAAVAAAAVALTPMQIYYTRFARGYALTALLGLLFAGAILRVVSARERRGLALGAAFLLAVALLYTHLSTAGFLLGVGLAGVLVAWKRAGARAALVLTATLAGAAATAFLLYVPLLDDVRAYFTQRESNDHPTTWTGIPTLLYGGRVAALIGVPLTLLGAVRLGRRGGPAAWVALAAAVGPAAVLLATRPHGMEYAWARYLLLSQPFFFGFAALGLGALLTRAPGAAPAVGMAAFVGVFLTGPQGPLAAADAPFDNSYLELYSLAPFDARWDGASPVYAEIAADPDARRIVELPPITTRGVLLYRANRLIHGQGVWIGWSGERPRAMGSRPYVDLSEISAGEVDWVVLHREPAREVREYFRFVYEDRVPALESFGEAGFLERHQAVFLQSMTPPEAMNAAAALLRDKLGPATYKDDAVLAWKLTPRAARADPGR